MHGLAAEHEPHHGHFRSHRGGFLRQRHGHLIVRVDLQHGEVDQDVQLDHHGMPAIDRDGLLVWLGVHAMRGGQGVALRGVQDDARTHALATAVLNLEPGDLVGERLDHSGPIGRKRTQAVAHDQEDSPEGDGATWAHGLTCFLVQYSDVFAINERP